MLVVIWIPLAEGDLDYLENYYANYDEEGRLASKHGQVELLTTMKYIHEFISGTEKKKILEVGAGTGRYSSADLCK